MVDMFYDQLEDAKDRGIPFVIPIGTVEYHARHASCGTDTMVITGCLRELEKRREIVICPPIWYGVASYAVCGPRVGHVQVDEDVYAQYLYQVLRSMVYGGVKNIYCVVHHQTEAGGLMPMTIACHKAAKNWLWSTWKGSGAEDGGVTMRSRIIMRIWEAGMIRCLTSR